MGNFYREKAGVISENALWCVYHRGYFYASESLFDLIKILVLEWNDDKHLIG